MIPAILNPFSDICLHLLNKLTTANFVFILTIRTTELLRNSLFYGTTCMHTLLYGALD